MKISQVIASLALSLVVAELGARLIFPVPEVSNFDRANYTPYFSRDMKQQQSLSNATFEYPSDPDGAASLHELNLYGFRDTNWDLERDSAVPRILFIGDSFVEGFLAPQNGSIPAMFEARAREKQAGPIEVLNLGVGAIGVPVYVNLIADAVPLFRPDVVFVVLYANDIRTEPFHAEFPQAPDPTVPQLRSTLDLRILTVVQKVMYGVAVARRWRSQPLDFFESVPSQANPWSAPGFGSKRGQYVSPKLKAAMMAGRFNPLAIGEVKAFKKKLKTQPFMTSFLAGANEFVQSYGASLVVAYLPGRNQVTDAYLKYHEEYSSTPPPLASLTGKKFQLHANVLEVECGKIGIPFYDLTPIVKSHEDRGERLYWKYDSHMSEAGYAVVGRALFDWAADKQAL